MCVKARGGAIASTGCTAYGLGSSPPDELSGGLESYFFYEIGQDKVTTIGEAHSGSITVNSWNQIAVTINSGTCKGYINGAQVFSGACNNPLISNSGDHVWIGNDNIE
jgi:hypothetical protein